QHSVQPAAVKARERPQWYTTHDSDHDRQHTDDHRALRPPDHPRPDVTPEFVGTEVVRGTGALQHLTVILLHRIIAGQERLQERHQKYNEHHHSAYGCQAIAP